MQPGNFYQPNKKYPLTQITDQPITNYILRKANKCETQNQLLNLEVIDMGGNPEIDEAMEMINRWKKLKTDKHFVDLQTSEQVLVRAASEIYAAYIQRGLVEDGKERL
jgi:hypothetical protein